MHMWSRCNLTLLAGCAAGPGRAILDVLRIAAAPGTPACAWLPWPTWAPAQATLP